MVRFADKERHQIFLEPEGKESREWYVQGMSTSMPEDVQWAMYRTIPGLRRCEFTRLGYAIEYDCIDSRELRPTLESLRIGGLFCAGPINGTSGYEEAACQGLLAGMNAALTLQGKEPVILTRDMAYIGVLTDDLTTKGTDEPYRMMTSRAEHRLYLRQDNADLRLTEIGHKAGLAGEERLERTRKKREETEKLLQELQTIRFAPGEALNGLLARKGEPEAAGSQKAEDLLKRPGINLKDLAELHPEWAEVSPAAAEQAEISVKYAGYLEKQEQLIRRARALEETRLSPDIPYEEIEHLRLEARQKLAKQKPVSQGAAGRIPGVNPADVAVLEVWLRTREHNKAAGS